MTITEFFILVDKFKAGLCTNEEEKVLFKFCEKLQIERNDIFKTLINEEDVKNKIFKNIQKETLTSNLGSNKKTPFRWQKIAASVAVFIFLGLGYYFTTNSSSDISNNNAISLELFDGTIEVLKDNSIREIMDSKGKVIAYKTNNVLRYAESSSAEQLQKFNTLRIPKGKTFELILSDGTHLHLNAGTLVKYPLSFSNASKREITVNGEALLKVTKDITKPFLVKTNNLNIQVLGTEFNVQDYPDDNFSEVVLLEGSVSLNTKKADSKAEILKPNQKAVVRNESLDIKVEDVIAKDYTSWKDGELVFKELTFNEILKKLERHYDVVIINNNSELSEVKFNASFGKIPIEVVLNELKINYKIEYEINNNQIIIK